MTKAQTVVKWILLSPLILFGVIVTLYSVMHVSTIRKSAHWDNVLEELCSNEGGVIVFEQIPISESEYNERRGRFNSVPIESLERVSPDFPYYRTSDGETVRPRAPEITKLIYRIVRLDDEKVLGQYVTFIRRHVNTLEGLYGGFHSSCRSFPGEFPNLTNEIFAVN